MNIVDFQISLWLFCSPRYSKVMMAEAKKFYFSRILIRIRCTSKRGKLRILDKCISTISLKQT